MKICVALPSARKPSSRSAIDIKEILRPSGPPRCANISTAAGSRACQCLVSERESPSPTCQLKQKGRKKKKKNQSQSEPPKSRPSALVGAFFYDGQQRMDGDRRRRHLRAFTQAAVQKRGVLQRCIKRDVSP